TAVLVSDVLGARATDGQAGGIRILCDTAVNAISAQPTTCFLTVELPWPFFDPREDSLAILGYQLLVLPGNVATVTSSAGGEIVWTVKNFTIMEFLAGILGRLSSAKQESRILARLRLIGDFIWSQSDPGVYLDGEAFGFAQQNPAGGNSIGVQLPQSGNGKRGGDFEMWFWLVLPITLSNVQFSPNPVAVTPGAAATATGTLNLIGTQLTAGNTVTLSAHAQDATGKPIATNIGTVPPSITLGTDPSPTFPVTGITLPPGIASAQLQVTATYGAQSVPGTLSINAQVTLIRLAFTAASVVGGAAATLTVVLNIAAPAGGVTVPLSSNANQVSPLAATVPPTAIVPAGSTTVQVPVPTAQRANTFPLQVTGTLGGPPITASINITGALTPVPPVVG
ncbi:MAG: hypothetical protein WA738_07665, partial [Candidatus Angelobacter sp.]